MVILMILIIGTATGYDLQCPAQSEWRLRANVSCYSEDKYVCLFHLLENKYEENCLGSDQSSIGSMLVFQPLFNLAECNIGRYQPIVFTTHGNIECLLIKSKCTGEGQVVYNNGSNSTDITCRCDYKKGYAFVSRPKNTCFCIPSEEDCSCLSVTCPQLSPDYQCITEGEILMNKACREIHSDISYNTHNSTVQCIVINRKSYSNAPHVAYIIITSIAVCIVLALLTAQVFVSPQILSQETVKCNGRNIGVKCRVSSYLPLTSVIWCKEPGEHTCTDTKSYNVFRCNGIRTLTYENPDYEPAAYKCIASNMIGTVESDPVQLYDNKRQKFIHELMLKGECGKLHFARLVFIGKNGVGKTSLMRRLLWQHKEDVTFTQSTDGIEVEKCNINIKDGKWSHCDKISHDLTRLIHQVYREKVLTVEKAVGNNDIRPEHFGSNTDEINRVLDDKKFSHSSDKSDNIKTDVTGSESFERDDTLSIDISRTKATTLVSENIKHNAEAVQTDINQIQPDNIKFQNVNDNTIHSYDRESDSVNDKIINQLTSTIMKSHFQQQESEQDDMMASCWLWDFAGQKDFYATHQVFLSNCAIYLLVTDSLEFTTADSIGIDIEDSAKCVSFWFDVIHCYWSTTKKDRLDPPIIVVCTNEDKFKEPSRRKNRQDTFHENLGKVLKGQEKKKHLRNIYFVSNTEDDDNVFEEIRNDISRHAMDMKDWGIDCPLKWLLFQQVLGKLSESGVPISTTMELSKIAKHDDIGITNNYEFKQCLQYCHDNGTVIYFEEESLQDHVILDPKWLVDAFRCLVTDKIANIIKVSDDWQNLTETGELTDKLISDLFKKEPNLKFFENKTHLIEVMKRFDIIVDLKNSNALYMPCMMKSCSFEKFRTQIFVGSQARHRTSWFCLDFEFLPPAFFNHILVWYIKRYSVSVILEQGLRNERKALYRQIGVFDLDSSGCEQLVVCEGRNIIALQVWNLRVSKQTYGDIRTDLIEFIVTLRDRYRLKLVFTITFKCKDGDFNSNLRKLSSLLPREYLCKEHETTHLSDDLVKPWGLSAELQLLRDTEYYRKNKGNTVKFTKLNRTFTPPFTLCSYCTILTESKTVIVKQVPRVQCKICTRYKMT
ncbi:unnamed protein product [Mytilus coruscus]|uniref:Ig-like domain-containing protein n=1 Tax=Mytilus coruscus TaxID=42192 RepID=A0A6J8APY1_MYTCO|nr:unnamed protein product [Mytilus coruscus]